jgi:SET domain-containing protein
MLIRPNKLYIKNSIYGRGVFALDSIKEGEILEECHFIKLESSWESISDPLKEYVFSYPPGSTEKNCIVLGYGSIYNHKIFPNAYWEYNPDLEVFRFIAKTDINKDDEIFINYGKWVDFI